MALDPDAIRTATREIESAFGGLAPPGDDKLLHPRCMDDGDVADFYGAPDWRELSDETIIRGYAAPCFFSAEAFRYYMPAFMVWSLEHHDTVEYAAEATIRAFDPGAVDEVLRRFQASKFALLTEAQRKAVVRFLETFSHHPQLGPIAKDALRNYWR
jgi:hypothetical protein